ncbi:MAG: PrsW family intramembrane metalloprotease [Candidatus Binatia bacterium]
MNEIPPRIRQFLALLLSMPAMVWTADLLAGTPPLIIAAAVIPAILLATAILLAQRGGGRGLGPLLFSLGWGALGAAWLSSSGNEMARPWIDGLAGTDGRGVTAVMVAPALEEAAKALGLVLILLFGRAALRDERDGIVYGALIGTGFVCTENLLYLGISMLLGGEDGLTRALYLRGAIGGATHVVFTACAGAVLGWSLRSAGRRAPGRAALTGFLVAAAQHVAWNALAAPMMGAALCGAKSGEACLAVPTNAAVFGEATGIALVFLAPGIALLCVAWRASRPAA